MPPLAPYLLAFLAAVAPGVVSCSPDKIFPRPYPARWPALKHSSAAAKCPAISGVYEVTGEVGYPQDTEQERELPFEGWWTGCRRPAIAITFVSRLIRKPVDSMWP